MGHIKARAKRAGGLLGRFFYCSIAASGMAFFPGGGGGENRQTSPDSSLRPWYVPESPEFVWFESCLGNILWSSETSEGGAMAPVSDIERPNATGKRRSSISR
jgi:hypothetical protein